MPIASFQLPDGKIADFEVPEGMSQEEIEQAVGPELRRLVAPPAPPKPEESGFLRQAADIPVTVAKGAASGVRAIADIFGANNPVSRGIRGAEDYLDSLLSAEARNDQQEIARIMKEAEDKGIAAEVTAAAKAFASAPVDFLAQALGSAAPAVAGGLYAKLLKLGAAGVGAVTTGIGGATGAGIVKGSVYDAVKGALTEAGESPEVAEARAQAAQSYGGENWGQILLGTALGGLAGRTGVEKLLLNRFGKGEVAEQAAKGVGRRAAEGAVTEAIPEMAQAGQEQLAQNIALQREGFDVSTLRGVAGAATLEGLAGGALGGGLGALSRGAPPAAPVEAPPEAPPAPPVVTNYQTVDQAGNPTTISVAQDDAGTIVATGPDGEPIDLSNMVSAGFTIEDSIQSVFSAPDAPVVPAAAAPAPRVEPEITLPSAPEITLPPEAAPPREIGPTFAEEAPPPFETTPVSQEPLPKTPDEVRRDQEMTELSERADRLSKVDRENSLLEFFTYRPKKDKEGKPIQVPDNRLDPSEVTDIASEKTKTGKIIPDKAFNFIRKKGGQKISTMINDQSLNEWLPFELRIYGTETAEELAEKEPAAEEYIKTALRNSDFLPYETKMELDTIGMTLDGIETEIQREIELDDLRDILAEIAAEEESARDIEQTLPEGTPTGAPEPTRPARTETAEREELKLTGESNAEIAARLARQETDREAAERKAIADRERGLFTLTPQVSEAESAPTGDMFGARGLADQAPKRAAAPATETGLFETKVSFQKAPPKLTPPPDFKLKEGRNEQVVLAARELAAGRITKEEYDRYVEYHMPVYKVDKPEAPLDAEGMKKVLRSNQVDKINEPIKDGAIVGLRMDINALKRGKSKGINGSVVTAHPSVPSKGKEPKVNTNTSLGYYGAARIKNVRTEIGAEIASFEIAQNLDDKKPQQVLIGEWVNQDPKEIYSEVQSLLKDPSWTQVSLDPLRHSFFYDRSNMMPVASADEVLQVGRFVLAKNVKYESREKFLYSVSGKKQSVDTSSPNFKRFFKDSKVVDENGKPLIMYHATAEELFDTFNKEKIRAVDYDTPFNGFWFSSDKFTSPAMRDAKNTIPVFLSIKNPAPSDVWKQVSKQVYKESDLNQESALRKSARSVGDEIRYRLQDMGYDGIQYSGKPNINKKEFEKTGQVSFKDFSGKSYTLVKNDKNGGVDLYDGKVTGKPNLEKDEYITDYLDLDNFLETEIEQVWVAFEPNQIKSAISNTGEFSPSDPRITQSVGNVTDIAEAQRVEKALKGKNPLQAAKWMADNATNPDYRMIAKRIVDRMQKLMDAGVPFKLHIVGVGDKVPVGLLSADGTTSSLIDRSEKKVLSVDIWLNNSTVTGRVGTEEKIVLHELIHAVTAGATYLGNLKSMQGTEAAKLFTRLYDVRNAVVRHFNSRVKSVPIDQLTALEKKVYVNGANVLKDEDEILAWGLTDPDMQAYLESIPYKGKTAWNAFVDAIREFLGLPKAKETALSEVLAIADELFALPVMEAGKQELVKSAPSAKPIATQDQINLFNASVRGQKVKMTPTAEGQAALDTINDLGRQVEETPTMRQKAREYWDNATDNPQATKEAAKKATVRFLDKIETYVFNSDAAINNSIRRLINETTMSEQEKMGILLSISSSQAVHPDALANLFIRYGGLNYDPSIYKYVATDKKDNFVSLVQGIDTIGTKYGLTKEQAERVSHTAFEAKRLSSIARFNRALKVEIDDLRDMARTSPDPTARDLASKEVRRKVKDFKFVHMTDEQIQRGLDLFKTIPELNALVDTWNGIRENSRKELVESGLWSEQEAEGLLSNMDYVPFYREDQLEKGKGPKEFLRNLQVQAKEKKLKGSDKPVADIFDNMARWTQYAVKRSVMNRLALAKIDAAVEMGIAKKVEKQTQGDNSVRVWRDGNAEYYSLDDPLFMEAFTGLESVAIPSLKYFAKLSNWLRKSVVLYPLFSVSQVPQDAFAAMFSSGLKTRFALTIPARAVKEFVKTLFKSSQTHKELERIGVVGIRDFTAQIAREDAEIYAGLKARPGVLNKVKSFLEHVSMASDNAVRQAVYEASIAQGTSRAEAIEKAFNLINFRNRGSSKELAIAGQIIPFFNAYLAAQHVAYRTISGVGISPTERKAALGTLAATTASVMALSLIYAMLIGDDEDYLNKPSVMRDRLFMIPGTGLSIPIRSDIFSIPKIVTEHMYMLMTDNGASDGRKFRDSMKAALGNALLSPTVFPQAIKPAFEVGINYNFFQGRPLVGTYQKGLETERQFNDSTSELAKWFGQTGLISPIAADHLIRGMFGSAGGLALYMTNFALHNDPEVPRPAMSFMEAVAALPGTSGFVSKEYETALKNDFYVLRDEVSTAVNTLNDLKKRSPHEIEEFLADETNLTRVGMAKAVNRITKNLTDIRRAISQITASDQMSASEKAEQIRELKTIEREILQNVDLKSLREMANL